MKRGVPPTALNARTGLLTPPGITSCASAKSRADRSVGCAGTAVFCFMLDKKHLVVKSVVASQAQKHLRHPMSPPYRRVAHTPLDQPSASLFRRDGSPIPPCYDDRVRPHRASEGEILCPPLGRRARALGHARNGQHLGRAAQRRPLYPERVR